MERRQPVCPPACCSVCCSYRVTKFLNNPRQDEKLPEDPDIYDSTLTPIPVYTIDTLLPYEEYTTLKETSLNIGPLTEDKGRRFRQLLEEFADLFASDINELGRTNLVTHRIYTEDVPSINSRPYSIPPSEQTFVKEEIQQMLDNKLIQPSNSPWTSPVVLVRKKNSKLCFCVDYRKLNAITKKDAYPLPRIDEMLNTLAGSNWFSTLDLASGYWQVTMHPRD